MKNILCFSSKGWFYSLVDKTRKVFVFALVKLKKSLNRSALNAFFFFVRHESCLSFSFSTAMNVLMTNLNPQGPEQRIKHQLVHSFHFHSFELVLYMYIVC